MSFPRKVIKHVLMVALWVTPCTLPGYASDTSEKENKARLTIHNVGVGQCYDLEIYDASSKSTKYILIGYGIEELRSLPNTYDSLDPVSKVNISPSDYRPSPLVTPLSSEELIRELRRKFRRKDRVGDVIDVDAVILTHPLKDSGLVMDLFQHEADHLRHLYLTGLPENYYPDKSGQFWSWLKEKEMRKTHIHFLALKNFTVDSLHKGEIKPYRKNYFTRSVKSGEEVFNFGDVKISVLSMNPTHSAGNSGKILRSSLPEDLHSDSLLLKIICGKSSIILSGSATSLTTNRAIDNYDSKSSHAPKDLQANILVASQYGSTLQGANNKVWLEKVNPEYVIISHGSSQATFDQTLYDSLKSLKRLKDSLPPHEIEVQIPEEHVSTIQQGIFSTLKSGTITIDLYKKSLKVRTEKEGVISQPGIKSPLEKQESVLIRRPPHHSHSHLFSASSSPSVKSSPKMVSRQRIHNDFSDRDSATSSPQTEKSQRKNLPRTQSLSPTKEKSSAREKHHEKTPEHKKEKPFFHHVEKSEFESDESSSRFNKLKRSDRKKTVSDKKHTTNTLSSPRGKTTFVKNKHHELTSGSRKDKQRNEKHLSPRTEKRKQVRELSSDESSNGFKRLDLSESDEGSSGKGEDKTKNVSSFNSDES